MKLKQLDYLAIIERSWPTFPIVALIGARQVGKTTMARTYAESLYPEGIPQTHYFDLEEPLRNWIYSLFKTAKLSVTR